MHSRLTLALVALSLSGCFGPNQANIKLRKQIQTLDQKVAELEEANAAARARIAGLEQTAGSPTTQGGLDQTFTVHDVKLGRLSAAGSHGVKLYLSPEDEGQSPMKATGFTSVEVFDLTDPANRVIDHWELKPEDMRSRWRSLGPLNAFVLELPWTQPATAGRPVGVKVTFRDALTRRIFRIVGELPWDETAWR